ncbi:MAG: hypothetical protein LBM96_06285 [Methanobrevibacter sp.]|jgi:nitroreductase|nr:hypothetical protein [Candidatus Methanoflexus mossambicus]
MIESKEIKGIIEKRKSIRKYKSQILSEEILNNINKKIDEVIPLYSDISYSIEIIKNEKPKNKKAPYYLIFCGENNDKSYENIGFIGQQLNLYFAMIGIGACWQMGKPKAFKNKFKDNYNSNTNNNTNNSNNNTNNSNNNTNNNNDLDYIVSMAFGEADEKLYRELDEFNRKPLSKISEGKDNRLNSVRLSPSGINAQSWYFIAKNNEIHCYRRKLNFLTKFLLNKLNAIDIGIAICHIYYESENFNFLQISNPQKKEGFIYVGTVTN